MELLIEIIATANTGRFVINQNEKYSYQARSAKIIWLSEAIDLMPDDNKIYKVKYSSGKFFEGIISQVGQDDIGFYIVLTVLSKNLRNDISIINKNISLGKAILVEAFNYENIPGLKKLSKIIGEQWRFELNSIISLEKVNKNICIFFRDDILNDIIVKLEMIGISKEDGFDNIDFDVNYNSIIMKNIFIRKEDKDGFVIYLEDNKPNHFLLEMPQENSDNVEYYIEKNDNITRICCNKITFSYYNCFVEEMKKRNIDCICSDEYKADSLNAKQLRKQWIDTFTKNVDISKVSIEQNLWHVFSYKKLQCYEKEEANKKINKIPKKFVYIFFDNSDIFYVIENAENFTLEDIKCCNNNDIYITDREFTWTYTRTHEDGWLGPYFYSNELS